jgi:subtilisin family serine protease
MRKAVVVVMALCALAAGASAAAAQGAGRAQTRERFFVGFAKAPGASERAVVARHGGAVRREFPEVAALAIEMDPGRLGELARESAVRYVEPDEKRYPLGLADAELSPALDNGLYGLVTTRAIAAHAAGFTGAGVKTCVADTGIDYTHPDIAPNYVAGTDTHDNDGDPWWNNDPQEVHGTHVAGTVLAAHNSAGVLGVAYNAQLYHARVLGPDGGSTSDIMRGVDWLQAQGCKVVNLSLGGGRKSRTEESFYKQKDSQGLLVVAAAGNDGTKRLGYPAGYTSVVSVAAVDADNQIADFSDHGRGLDLSAPGVQVLSSVPVGQGTEASVSAGGSTFRASGLEFAGNTSGITGPRVSCGLAQSPGDCGGAAPGFVALIQRGTNTFADKVTNATTAGATAAIIYNTVAGDFSGTLGSAGPWIPAVSVSDAAGAALSSQPSATVVNIASSWAEFDGTSMATPHVTGVAALAFQAHPGWSNHQVEARLKASAQDLGAAGYDTTYGYGLVDAQGATAP